MIRGTLGLVALWWALMPTERFAIGVAAGAGMTLILILALRRR